MSHDSSQDKAVKKLGISENILLRIIAIQVLLKRVKANFQPGHFPESRKNLES